MKFSFLFCLSLVDLDLHNNYEAQDKVLRTIWTIDKFSQIRKNDLQYGNLKKKNNKYLHGLISRVHQI